MGLPRNKLTSTFISNVSSIALISVWGFYLPLADFCVFHKNTQQQVKDELGGVKIIIIYILLLLYSTIILKGLYDL